MTLRTERKRKARAATLTARLKIPSRAWMDGESLLHPYCPMRPSQLSHSCYSVARRSCSTGCIFNRESGIEAEGHPEGPFGGRAELRLCYINERRREHLCHARMYSFLLFQLSTSTHRTPSHCPIHHINQYQYHHKYLPDHPYWTISRSTLNQYILTISSLLLSFLLLGIKSFPPLPEGMVLA